MDILEAIVSEPDRLSVEEFLALDDDERRDIKNVTIVPPSFGEDDDFGSFLVDWKTPRYRVDL